MSYIKRNIEITIEKAAKMFPAVLVTGARQVGKTTVLKHNIKDIPYLTLDDQLYCKVLLKNREVFLKPCRRL